MSRAGKILKPQLLVLISDSTGDLGERFLRAMITQFPKGAFILRVFSFVQRPSDLPVIFDALHGDKPIIFHTVLFAEFKKHIAAIAKKEKCPVYDLTGNAMDFLERTSNLKGAPDALALHELNQEYEQRINSLDFTVGHDDGLNTRSLREAQIVLLGVSRTSKTPTSIYLAYKGFRTANIPLIKGMTLPPELLESSHPGVVGLTIDPEKLREIRIRRAHHDRIPGDSYTDHETIVDEVRWARALFTKLGCPVVDVTNHAVEETAALVLKALHLR